MVITHPAFGGETKSDGGYYDDVRRQAFEQGNLRGTNDQFTPTSDSGQVVVKELQHSSDHPRAIAIGSHELGIGTLNSALTKALHDPD